MKVVGISGAQGAGKSTLLVELEKRGWALDGFRVSRAVQAALGWDSLAEVMSHPTTMIQFQEEVFSQKLLRDRQLVDLEYVPTTEAVKNKASSILTERTFADIHAYTTQWVWRFVEQDRMDKKQAFDFLSTFRSKCVAAQLDCYAATILLPYMDHVAWEDDPNRADRADVDRIFEDIVRFTEQRPLLGHKVLTITAKSVADRADQVEKFLLSLE